MAIQRLLTARGVSEILNLREQTVRRKALKGEIPSHKVGKSYRFKESDIQDYLENVRCEKNQSPHDERLSDFALNLCKQKKESLVMRKSRLPQRLNLGYGGYYKRIYKGYFNKEKNKFIESSVKGERWFIWIRDESKENGRKEMLVPFAASAEDALEALEFKRKKKFDASFCCPECGFNLAGDESQDMKKLTFEQFSKEFLETHNKKNAQGDKSIINLHLISHFGRIALDRISIKDVDTYLMEKEAQGLKQGTINQHLICLRKMLYKAKEYDYIKEIIPISKRELAVTDAREGKVIADEHFWMIHEKAEPFMQKMMIVSRLSSCRGNELRTLQWDCVKLDGDDSKFIIRPEFDKAKKGKKCVITKQMRPVFDELKKSRNSCENVFSYSDRPINKSRFSSAWVKAVIDAGFKKGFYKFHDLRHTALTVAGLNGSIGFRTIQSLAGQHDAKTTQKYMHDNWEKQKEAAEVLTLDSNDKKVRRILEK